MQTLQPRSTVHLITTLAVLISAPFVGWSVSAAPSPAERRARILQLSPGQSGAIAELTAALDDENMVVRRTAARKLGGHGGATVSALETALSNSDDVVRKIALQALFKHSDDTAKVGYLARMIADDSLPVRLMVVNALAAISPRTKRVEELLEAVATDAPDAVRQVATRALWPFHRDVIPLRERSDWDHDVEVVQAVRLPKAGWKFHLDPERSGHQKDWYKPDFSDAEWKDIEIEQAWQKADYDYIGVAWYRRWVDVPAKPEKMNAVEITFQGVDESTWVWVNGTYIGKHDIGPTGWNQAFSLDITDAVKWGEKNHIAVRAMNTAHAGGIWKPVDIEILK